MQIPESLNKLVDYGVIDDVLRPLMSGKEAQIYLVDTRDGPRVAKIYKDAQHRSFKKKTDYTEGRKVRNSRDRRAMAKRSKHGRDEDEAAWRSAEVETIYKLRAAGVRVPEPFHYVDGVLVMELVTGTNGLPAPRLADVELDREQGKEVFEQLLRQVIRMLCAGVVHGDLSGFNVLMSDDGPVIIDFPQSIDAAANRSAKKLLLRDVENLYRLLHRSVRNEIPSYGEEIWELYQKNQLHPDSKLSGKSRNTRRTGSKKADTEEVLRLISESARDARGRGGRRPQNNSRPTESTQGNGKVGRMKVTQVSKRGIIEVQVEAPGSRARSNQSRGRNGRPNASQEPNNRESRDKRDNRNSGRPSRGRSNEGSSGRGQRRRFEGDTGSSDRRAEGGEPERRNSGRGKARSRQQTNFRSESRSHEDERKRDGDDHRPSRNSNRRNGSRPNRHSDQRSNGRSDERSNERGGRGQNQRSHRGSGRSRRAYG